MQKASWAAQVIRFRALVLLAAGVLAGVSIYYCTRLSFDNSVEGWFLEGDPSIVAYHEFLDRFVGDEISVIGIMAPDVFAPQVIKTIDRLTRAASSAPHTHRVRSLTNVKIFDSQGDAIEIRPLVRHASVTSAEASELRRQALENPLLVGALVSQTAKATAVVVELTGGPDLMARKVAQARALEQIIKQQELPAGVQLHLTGTPALDKAFYDHNERDFRLILPLSSLVVLLVVYVFFRRLVLTIVPTLVVGLGVLFTFGVMGALGIKVNILSTMVAALILAVGVADSVHVLADYQRYLAAGQGRREALERSLVHLLVPCFFTSVTTAAGFLSLLASSLQPIREAGWLAALGVSVAFVLSMTVVPALLSYFKTSPAQLGAGLMNRLVASAAERLGGMSLRASRLVLLTSGVLVVVVVVGIGVGGLEVGANPIEYFRRGDRIRTATELVDRQLGGSTSIEATVQAPNGGLKDPEVLRKLDRLQGELGRLPGVSKVISIVDYLKELNRVIHGGSRSSFVLPTQREVIAQYYLLLEGEDDLDSLVQSNYSLGRMTARVSFTGSSELAKQLPQVEQRLAREFNGPDLQIKITGFVKLMGDMERYLVRSQMKSMLIAFAVISIMMFVLLRSVKLGVFAMIPNLVPIVLGLGFMALMGIGLDPGTVMIGSIALGLVVDDTVHFLVQLRRQRRIGGGGAVVRSMRASGQPIIITSIVLVAGFCVSTLGSFNPNVNFGLISAVVIVLALAADLVMLPAALKVLRPKL